MSGSRVLSFADKLKNHTGAMYYENPVDLAIVIEAAKMLLHTQVGETVRHVNDGNCLGHQGPVTLPQSRVETLIGRN